MKNLSCMKKSLTDCFFYPFAFAQRLRQRGCTDAEGLWTWRRMSLSLVCIRVFVCEIYAGPRSQNSIIIPASTTPSRGMPWPLGTSPSHRRGHHRAPSWWWSQVDDPSDHKKLRLKMSVLILIALLLLFCRPVVSFSRELEKGMSSSKCFINSSLNRKHSLTISFHLPWSSV